MNFKEHYLALPVNERESLALQAGTTRGMLNQIVYGGKQIELGLADCLVALCGGLTLGDLPLTDRAKQQHAVRGGTQGAKAAKSDNEHAKADEPCGAQPRDLSGPIDRSVSDRSKAERAAREAIG